MTILVVRLTDSTGDTNTRLELDDSGFDEWTDLDPATSQLINQSGSIRDLNNPAGLRCVGGIDLIGLSWG